VKTSAESLLILINDILDLTKVSVHGVGVRDRERERKGEREIIKTQVTSPLPSTRPCTGLY
jgi:hypothetical protein